MNWNDVLARLKDARTWTMFVSLANLIMLLGNVTPQVVEAVDAALFFVAFVLFGVEPAVKFIRRMQG